MPVSISQWPDLSPGSFLNSSFLLTHIMGGNRWWLKQLGTYHHVGDLDWILTSRFSLAPSGLLRAAGEWTNRWELCISTFQIDKNELTELISVFNPIRVCFTDSMKSCICTINGISMCLSFLSFPGPCLLWRHVLMCVSCFLMVSSTFLDEVLVLKELRLELFPHPYVFWYAPMILRWVQVNFQFSSFFVFCFALCLLCCTRLKPVVIPEDYPSFNSD